MKMDVLCGLGHGADMNGFHAQTIGNNKVAAVIFKHRGLGGVYLSLSENFEKCVFVWLWFICGVFDSEDAIKKALQATRFKDAFCVGCTPICIDDFAARKAGYMLSQGRVGGERMKRDVMDLAKIWLGVDIVKLHQPRQSCSVV